ncbi:hypothetical protein Hdeb2414_s0016g00488921 [Helianthus debilis subsp. tardiflorus]
MSDIEVTTYQCKWILENMQSSRIGAHDFILVLYFLGLENIECLSRKY